VSSTEQPGRGDEIRERVGEPGLIEPTQFYETEIAARGTDLAVRFIVLPTPPNTPAGEWINPGIVLPQLELRQLSQEPLSPSLLPAAIASLLQAAEAPEPHDRYAVEHLDLVVHYPTQFVHDHPDVAAFSEYVAFAPVVPIEQSPLSTAALGQLLTVGGIGGGIGLLAAGGPTPLLLVTVPVGIILCAAAKGAGEGLADGLRHRIRQWMGVPASQQAAPAQD